MLQRNMEAASSVFLCATKRGLIERCDANIGTIIFAVIKMEEWPIILENGRRPTMDWQAEPDENGNTVIYYLPNAYKDEHKLNPTSNRSAYSNPLFVSEHHRLFLHKDSHPVRLNVNANKFFAFMAFCERNGRVPDFSPANRAPIVQEIDEKFQEPSIWNTGRFPVTAPEPHIPAWPYYHQTIKPKTPTA